MGTDTGTAKLSTMRRFLLRRVKDTSGVSGVGIVAEGCEWSNGHITLRWQSQMQAENSYDNAKVLVQLHGHNGDTIVEWIDV